MESETVYLITLGVVSIWLAAGLDTVFFAFVSLLRRLKKMHKAVKHCVHCAQLKARKITRGKHHAKH